VKLIQEKLIKSQLGEPVCGQVATIKGALHSTLFRSVCCFWDYIRLNECSDIFGFALS